MVITLVSDNQLTSGITGCWNVSVSEVSRQFRLKRGQRSLSLSPFSREGKRGVFLSREVSRESALFPRDEAMRITA